MEVSSLHAPYNGNIIPVSAEYIRSLSSMQYWKRHYRSCLSTLLSLAVIVEGGLLSVMESGVSMPANIIERSPLRLLLLSRPLCLKDYFAVLISVFWQGEGNHRLRELWQPSGLT